MIDHVFIESLYENQVCTQIALVRTDRKGKHCAAYSEMIDLQGRNGAPFAEVIDEITRQILSPKFDENYIVVTYKFDKRQTVLRDLLRQSWIYMTNLAWPLAYAGMVSSLSLDSISKYNGVINQAPSTAKGNVVAIMEAYWTMMRRFKTALSVEEGARQFGGDTLEEIRKTFGF